MFLQPPLPPLPPTWEAYQANYPLHAAITMLDINLAKQALQLGHHMDELDYKGRSPQSILLEFTDARSPRSIMSREFLTFCFQLDLALNEARNMGFPRHTAFIESKEEKL